MGMLTASSITSAPLILVVDDSDDTRLMYAVYLELEGFRVETAENGQDAIDKARSLKPAAIVMDLSMPVLDGWEATRILKGEAETASICIIALTGHGEASFAKRARDAGCDHFAVKPFAPPQLDAMLKACLSAAA